MDILHHFFFFIHFIHLYIHSKAHFSIIAEPVILYFCDAVNRRIEQVLNQRMYFNWAEWWYLNLTPLLFLLYLIVSGLTCKRDFDLSVTSWIKVVSFATLFSDLPKEPGRSQHAIVVWPPVRCTIAHGVCQSTRAIKTSPWPLVMFRRQCTILKQALFVVHLTGN